MNWPTAIAGFLGLLAFAVTLWKLSRPGSGCFYPHCPLDGSHCLLDCPHRRHSDFDGD